MRAELRADRPVLRFRPSAGLVALSIRRLISPPFLFASFALAALWLLQDHGIQGATETADVALLRATRRASTWFSFALFLIPPCIFNAARLGERWSRSDRDWIGARALSRFGFAFSTWLGIWFASSLVVLAIGVLAEFTADGDGMSSRQLRQLACPTVRLQESDARTTWTLDDPRGELRTNRELRLALYATPGDGPTARVRFSSRRLETDTATSTETIVSGRTRVQLGLPPGGGALEFTLEKLGAGCGVVALPDSLTLFEPTDSERAASLALFTHGILWLGAWSALALGLGMWMRAFTATLLTLALQLPLWSFAVSSTSLVQPALLKLIPGLELPSAFTLLGDGLALSLPAHTTFFGFSLLCALGFALAVTGMRRGGPA